VQQSCSECASRVTRYAYDGLDRLTTETWYDGTAPTASASTVTEGGPVNEVQRVGHIGAFSGTFTLTFSGQTTSAIAWNASAATVQSALEALSNIGTGDVAVVQTQSQGSTKEWQITFQNALGGINVGQITIDTTNLVYHLTAIQTTDVQDDAPGRRVRHSSCGWVGGPAARRQVDGNELSLRRPPILPTKLDLQFCKNRITPTFHQS
jgi:hypothetical protein